MKILVHLNQARTPGASPTAGTVTLVPGWLERLVGARTRSGMVRRVEIDDHLDHISQPKYGWVWTTTERGVGDDITAAIEAAEVAELPVAFTRTT